MGSLGHAEKETGIRCEYQTVFLPLPTESKHFYLIGKQIMKIRFNSLFLYNHWYCLVDSAHHVQGN